MIFWIFSLSALLCPTIGCPTSTLTPTITGAAWYVDADLGDDAGLGTNVSAWKTLSKLNNMTLMGPGTVFLKGTFSDGLVVNLDHVIATGQNPVRYTSWLFAQPATITANVGILITDGDSNTSHIGLEFYNLILNNNGGASQGLCFAVAKQRTWDYLRVVALSILNYHDGIWITGSSTVSNLCVQDSIFNINYHSIYLVASPKAVIERCEFIGCNNPLVVGDGSDGTIARDLTATSTTNNGYVIYCLALMRDVVFQRCNCVNSAASCFYIDTYARNVSILDSYSTNQAPPKYAHVLFTQNVVSVLLRNVTITTPQPGAVPCDQILLSDQYSPQGAIWRFWTNDVVLTDVTFNCGLSTITIDQSTTWICENPSLPCLIENAYLTPWAGDFDTAAVRVPQLCPGNSFITEWQNIPDEVSSIQAVCNDGTRLNLGKSSNPGPLARTASSSGFRAEDLVVRVMQSPAAVTQLMGAGNISSDAPRTMMGAPSGYSVVGLELQYLTAAQSNVSAVRFFLRTGVAVRVDYPTSLLVSQWGTFQIDQASPLGTAVVRWTFPQTTLIGSAVVHSPFTFLPGSYTFNITVDNVVATKYNFTVIPSPLVVILTGGDKEVAVHSRVTIDASQSYDPDLPQSNTTNSTLTYLWQINGVTQSTNSIIFSFLADTQGVLVVTVTVNSLVISGKSNTGSSEIRVNQQSPVGDINIFGPSSYSVSPFDTLRLLANVSNMSSTALTYTWTSTPNLTSSNAECNGVFGYPSSLAQIRALTLSGSCLQSGLTYRFTFQIQGQGGSNAAWINITVLEPPTGGTCEVSGVDGVSLVTTFHIVCVGWTSSSPVLTYALKLLEDSGDVVALSSLQYSPFFDVTLDGSASGSSVTLMAVVSDIAGSSNTVYIGPLALLPPATMGCPLTNLSVSIQDLTAAVQSYAFQTEACGDERQIVWNKLWLSTNQSILALPYLPGDSVGLYVNALEALKQTASLVLAPSGFTERVTALLTTLLMVGQATPNATKGILEAFPVLRDCASMQQSMELVGQNFIELTSIGNPGETAVVIRGDIASMYSQKFFSDSHSHFGTSSVSLVLPAALLSQGVNGVGRADGISTVRVLEYSAALAGCRQHSQYADTNVVGKIVDITLGTSQSGIVEVNNVNGGFSFSTTTGDKYCGKPVCAWWDPTQQTNGSTGGWSRVGCTTQSTPNAPQNVTCVCTHLTEFALILRPGCVSEAFRIAYHVMLAFYAVELMVVLSKIGYYFWRSGKGFCSRPVEGRMGVVLWQHFLIALLLTARIVACALLAQNRQDWSVAVRALVLLLPYIIQFWVYTLLAFQWASIHLFGMSVQSPFRRVRTVFIVSNTVIVACVVATIVGASTASSASLTSLSVSPADVTVTVASAVIACVTFITAISFLVYSIPLYQAIRNGDSSDNSEMKQTSRKLIVGAVFLHLLLCVQTFLFINTVVSHLGLEAVVGGDMSEVIILGADVLCIATILALYHRVMSPAEAGGRGMKQEGGEKKNSGKQGKEQRERKMKATSSQKKVELRSLS